MGRSGSGCVPALTASRWRPRPLALTHARRRLGPAPLRALFALVCGPTPSTATAGARIGGLLVCAIDGTTLSVADTPANHGVNTTQPGHHGGSGHPLLRLVAGVARCTAA